MSEENQQQENQQQAEDQQEQKQDPPKKQEPNYKKILKEYESKVKELESKLSDVSNKELKQQEKWKEIAEKREKENLELAKSRDEILDRAVKSQKYDAIYRVAKNLGLRKEAEDDLNLLSFDDVEVEVTSTGRFNVLNVDDSVSSLKKLKPHWFADSSSPKINGGGGKSLNKEITAKELMEARKKDPKKYAEMLPVYLESFKNRKK